MTSPTTWPSARRPAVHEHKRRTAVRVCVLTTDPLLTAGLQATLRPAPGIELVADTAAAEVTIAVADAGLHQLVTSDIKKLVLIADDLKQNELWTAIANGLVVLVTRVEATDRNRLLRAVHDARQGRGDLPPEHLGAVLHGLKQLHENTLGPRELTLGGFTQRETEVIKLLADGHDTAAIAEKLIYSERTVKNVLHNLLSRLNLRNRAHAVAYALRHGII